MLVIGTGGDGRGGTNSVCLAPLQTRLGQECRSSSDEKAYNAPMLRVRSWFGSPKAVVWFLLLWFVLLAPIVLIESTHSPHVRGILDGDSDDDVIAASSDFDGHLKLASTPSSGPEFSLIVAGAAPVGALRPIPFVPARHSVSRSPPLR